MEEAYVYLWLIHVDVWQKPSQYCNYLPIKNKYIHKNILAIEVADTFLEKKFYFQQVSSSDRFSLLEITCVCCEYFSNIKENLT